MKNSVKAVLTIGLLSAIATGGLAMAANAQRQTPTATATSVARIAQMLNREANEGPELGDSVDSAKEAREQAQYQSLAKITPQQAQQAAEAAQGGQASSVKLENEDGSLVYAVVIGQQEVKVDAGNGQVLYTEAQNHEDRNTEASRPRSSIQVTEAPGGDGDGETNDDV